MVKGVSQIEMMEMLAILELGFWSEGSSAGLSNLSN